MPLTLTPVPATSQLRAARNARRPALGGRIGGRARQRTDPSKRDGSHHVASVTGQEDTQSGIDEMHGTAQDHIELKIDFFGCVICHVGGDSHPCIADQNFQTLWPLGGDALAQGLGFGRQRRGRKPPGSTRLPGQLPLDRPVPGCDPRRSLHNRGGRDAVRPRRRCPMLRR